MNNQKNYKIFIIFSFVSFISSFYTENDNHLTYSIPTTNTLYSDYYCYSISSNLCISCYTSTNSYYLLNSNRKCAYNKDLLTNIFYHSIQHYAYAINPYCRIIPSTSVDQLNDLSLFPTTATVTPNHITPSSFTYECNLCYSITSPSNKKYALKAAWYKYDAINRKNYCVVDCKEVPFAVGSGNTPSDYCSTPYKPATDSCGLNCFYCSGTNPDGSNKKCRECVYTKFRYGDLTSHITSTPPDYRNQVMNTGLTCATSIDRITTSNNFGNFFISPIEFACVSPIYTCDGSYSSPFESLNALFVYLHKTKVIGKYTEVTLNIYLMKGGNHYVLDKYINDDPTPTFSFLKDDSGANFYQDELMLRAFERVSVTATITSAYINTNGCVSSTYCFLTSEKATIIWKSHLTSFWISKKLAFENIIIDGSDMFPYYNYNKISRNFESVSEYAYKKTQCCLCSNEGVCKQDPRIAGGTCLCGLKNSSIPIAITSKTFQEYNNVGSTGFHWHKRPYGVFNLEFLSDYAGAAKPELIIQNCIFKNFEFHLYSPTFIAIAQNYASFLKIYSTTFINFYHPYGLISNSYVPWMRDFPYYIPTNPQICTDKSLVEPCYYLLLDSCTFNISGRNASYVIWNPEADKTILEQIDNVQNEGIVLFLNNFNGPITIQNNKFYNLITFMRSFTSGSATVLDCALDSLIDMDTYQHSEQTIFIDNLMRYRIENDNTNHQFTGSILNIRNLRLGLILKENLFEDNVGYTGTGLFLHQFDIYGGSDESKASVILIENNRFYRNMALKFGLNIVIINYDKDYIALAKNHKCGGIQINGNTFLDNAGCPKTFGNVIISCSPLNLENKKTPFDKYDAATSIKSTTYQFAYVFDLSSNMNFNSEMDNTIWFRSLFSSLMTDADALNNYTLNIPPGPETMISTCQIDINKINIYDNVFKNNYAIVSNGLFVHGAKTVNLLNNSFYDNSIPKSSFNIHKITGYQTNIFLKNGLSLGDSTTVPSEASALIISLSMTVAIRNTVFSNNSASLKSNSYYGLAITLNKILPVDQILIENCSFINHKFDASSVNTKNVLSLISVGYLENFGMTYTTFFANPTASGFYYKNVNSNLTIIDCLFKNIYFQATSLTNLKLSSGSLLNFFSDLATGTGLYETSKDYSNGNSYSPVINYQLFLYNIICDYVLVYDGRPLISIFFNNIFKANKITFTHVLVQDDSLWGSYGGFFSLYLINNDYDFSYNTYKIVISNITLIDCEGVIVNINHPLQEPATPIYTSADVNDGVLNIIDLAITRHITTNTLFAFRQINMLFLANVNINTLSTNYGVFSYFVVQQSILRDTTKIFVQNLTALYIKSSKFAGFYMNGLLSAELKNITIKYISFLFTDTIFAENVNTAICIYVSTYLPYISNFTCSDIIISSSMSKAPNSLATYAVCFFFTEIYEVFTRNNKLGPSNTISCKNSKSDSSFNPSKYELYLGYLKNSKSLTFTNCSFNEHVSLKNGIYVYNANDIIMNNMIFSRNQIYSSNGNLIFFINGISDVTLSNSQITNNYCKSCLGCFGVTESSILNLYYSNITDNNASDSTGFLIKSSSTFVMKNCNILRNNASAGSAILSAFLSYLTITSCLFEDNQSYINGMKMIETLLSLKSCKFLQNYADKKSSNLYLSSNSVTSLIWDCLFKNSPTFFYNKTASTAQKGHFMFINDAQLLIQYTSFINGYSSIGGAIYFSASTAVLTLQYNTFINNTSDEYGGALYISGSAMIENSYFFNNSCRNKGSNLYLSTSASLTIINSYLNNTIESNIYMDYKSVIIIYGCILHGEGSEPINGLNCNLCTSIFIDSSLFSDFNQTKRNGAAIILNGVATGSDYDENDFLSFIIIGSTIKNCSSAKGSGIYIYGKVQANISSSVFLGNMAIYNSYDSESGKGGAVYYKCSNLYCSLQLLTLNKFYHNSADISGGAHHFTDNPLIFLDPTSSYLNNSALYGENQASYPMEIAFYENPPITLTNSLLNRSLSESLMNLGSNYYDLTSGTVMSSYIVFKILDEYGQVVSSDSSSVLSALSFEDSVTFGNASKFTAIEGYYILYPFSILSTPGSIASIYFSSSAIVSKFQRTDLTFTQTLNYSKYLRQCLKGEKRSDAQACYACTEGTFSTYDYSDPLYSGTVTCESCPEGALCKGYYFIGPHVGHWKYDSFSTKIFGCYNTLACLGAYMENYTALDCREGSDVYDGFCYTGWCAEGYTGILCEDCADGWAQADPLKRLCIQCTGNAGYYVKSIFLSLGAIAFIVWSIANAIKKSTKKTNKENKLDKLKDIQNNQVLPEKKPENEEKTPMIDAMTPQCKDSDKNHSIKSSPSPLFNENLNESNQNDPIIEQNYMKTIQIESFDEKDEKAQEFEEKNPEKLEEKKLENVEENIEKIDRSSIYVKILFNYIQILAILGNFPFNWPEELMNLFSSNKEAISTSQKLFSIDCFLKQDVFGKIGLRVFFTKLMLYALSPFGFLLICFVVWLLVFYRRYRSNMKLHKKEFKFCYITSMVILLFMIHPNIIQQDFAAFSCVDLNDENSFAYRSSSQNLAIKQYLQIDNQILCWDKYHLSWCYQIATPSLIFWGFGIPALAIYILHKNRHKLNDENTKSKYGFLYEGYKLNHYYWEFIILYRKILIIICAVFMVESGALIQGTFVMGVSAFNYLLQVWFEPYDQDVLNELEKRSLFCSAFTLYCSLYYIQTDVSTWFKLLLLVCILLLNCYFGIFWVKEFTRQKSTDLLENKFFKKYFAGILEKIVLQRKFMKGQNNIFDFDRKRIEDIKKILREKEMENDLEQKDLKVLEEKKLEDYELKSEKQ